eukprot:784640-Prorocentrum_minimum.AAC.2
MKIVSTGQLLDLLADLDQIDNPDQSEEPAAPVAQSPLAGWRFKNGNSMPGGDKPFKSSAEADSGPVQASSESEPTTGSELAVRSDGAEEPESEEASPEGIEKESDWASDWEYSTPPSLPIYVAPELSTLIRQFQGTAHVYPYIPSAGPFCTKRRLPTIPRPLPTADLPARQP